jgi:hypothetical protein
LQQKSYFNFPTERATVSDADDVLDYVIAPLTPAPADYPFGPVPDEYTIEPFSLDFETRKKAFLQFVLNNPAPTNTKAAYYELGRMHAGGTPHLGVITAAIDYVDARKDCADFVLHSILRLFYQFNEHPALNSELLARAQQSILSFKYWPDEPGYDSMCSWTENHYILFASAAYLAGQLFPDEIFSNSALQGSQIKDLYRSRILRWLNLRFFTGFSEWLSHVYYDEDLTALLSLADFCNDEEISQRACAIIDLLLFEMAIHNFKGVFASSHGRSYEPAEKWAAQESTISTQKLLFGRGIFSTSDNMSAIAFALSSSYRMPQVIFDITQDQDKSEIVNRQRMGIRLDQAAWWDLRPNNFENGMLLLTLEAYFHPKTVNLFVRMLNKYNWWQNDFFAPFAKRKGLIKTLRLFGLLPLVSRLFEKDVCRNTRQEVNVYTFRTPDYMLSAAQDYQKGYGGDQQHIWQASLGPDAVCFTTHPARPAGRTPNYWAGSGTLPRVAQIKNVVIAIYRISKAPAIYIHNELFLTHAWLPRDQFEQVVEEDGWVFARNEDGYLALFSQHPYHWHELPGEDQNREMITPGRNNIWLCELGRRAVDGNFTTFIQRILEAELFFRGSNVSYRSPSLGLIEFGWKTPLRLDDHEISLEEYPRFASPYAQVDFPPERFSIALNDQSLNLNWIDFERRATGFV